MKLPETAKGILFEKEAWESIIGSSNWVVYRKALSEHVIYLQNQVNVKLREQKNVEAYGYLIAMDDCNKFLDSINKRMSALNELSEKGGK